MNPDGSTSATKSTNNAKRRRGLGIVTPNACTECRKKRAKCDGKTPCARCSTQGVECIYEIPVRQSKENMRSEIEYLRNSQKQHERILQALVVSETSEQVLNYLRNEQTAETIVEQLDGTLDSSAASRSDVTTFTRASHKQAIISSVEGSPMSAMTFSDTSAGVEGQHHGFPWQSSWAGNNNTAFQQHYEDTNQEDTMKWEPDTTIPNPSTGYWHQQPRSDSTPDSTIQMARGEGQEALLGRTFGMEEPTKVHKGYKPNYNQSWTTVTNDGAFVEHLMALYFCWEYPTFASLSKEHFLEDFRTGNARHCSSLLVNALLALGCRFSNQADARIDPSDSNTAGDHFFTEALDLLHGQTDRHVLTTIQAMGLMSIREASCGRTSSSLFYSGQSIRLAMEMGLHLDMDSDSSKEAEAENAVRSSTFWGAFSLDQAWSLSIGALPHFSIDNQFVRKPAMIAEIEASAWVPYTDDGAPLEKACTQPSNVRSVYKNFCELSEIVHKSIYALYTPSEKVTSQQLIERYTEYLKWYEALPTTLRLGQNSTPCVLFAHMYYHFAILLLFRPFIKLSIPSSSVSPLAITLQAADAISALVISYAKLYTLRRTPSFVPYFVLTGCIIHLFALGKKHDSLATLQQGVANLKEMTSCHGFATRALETLKFLIKHWNVEVDINLFPPNIKAKTEEDLCKYSSTSFNRFCPNITREALECETEGGYNPLFWCFPMQGRPLLDVRGNNMEKAGFRILA